MTNEQEHIIVKTVEDQIKRARYEGLVAGSKGIAGAILEKCNSGKAPKKLVEEIKKFCEIGLGVNKNSETVDYYGL